MMILSGILPLDRQTGGMSPGRLHLLTGGPGAGKSTACLHFLQAGLCAGESTVLLTRDRSDDLQSLASAVGLDLIAPVRDNRVLLVRYREDFCARLGSATQPERVIDELRQLIGWVHPERLIIDPLLPFIAESASGAALAALAQWLDRLGATVLLTWPADVSAGYDTRLDPIVQRAAIIMHLAREKTGHRLQIVQNRTGPVPAESFPFLLRPGAGMVAPVSKPRVRKRLEIAQ